MNNQTVNDNIRNIHRGGIAAAAKSRATLQTKLSSKVQGHIDGSAGREKNNFDAALADYESKKGGTLEKAVADYLKDNDLTEEEFAEALNDYKAVRNG